VALSGTTFALLIFVVHDAMREHLKDLRDDLANDEQLQLQRQDALGIKYEIYSMKSDLVDRIFEIKNENERDTQKLESIEVERDRLMLHDIKDESSYMELILEESSALMAKVPATWIHAHSDSVQRLQWDCRCSKQFADLLLFTGLVGGHFAGSTIFDGKHYWADNKSALPDLLDQNLNWAKNAADASTMTPIISGVRDRMWFAKRAIDDFSAEVEVQANNSIKSYESLYDLWTKISYALYALVFAFNAWVVIFTTDKPELPD
jgi:hypothetical protein